MTAIYKREIQSYFTSPIGYAFITVFLAANAFVFAFCTLMQGAESSVSGYFTFVMWTLFIMIPILTMKMFSEERKTRTEQLLLTAPITLTGMVAGKFFAALTVFSGTFLLGGLMNFPLLYKYGTPNTAVLISSSIGIIMVGAAFIAIGMFISALTENQIVAAVGTIGFLFLTLIMTVLNDFIDVYAVRVVINWISVSGRFVNFTFGILDFASLLYYVSISFIFIFLTVRVYEKRRWS